MASIRKRTRADGSTYWAVLYRRGRKQTSTSFNDFADAAEMVETIRKFGVENAVAAVEARHRVSTPTGFTVSSWLTHHVDLLLGVDPNTAAKYRAYIRNDVDELIGSMPLTALTRDDIARWIQRMQQPGADGKIASAKTVSNKHGFLAGALKAAVSAGHLSASPSVGLAMPRDENPPEMVFLTRDQFFHLLSQVAPHYQPMVEFLVASGARWGEAAALRPSDVDRAAGTVRISRSWKQDSVGGGYKLGPPKTKKSRRTVNIPQVTLDKLDYSHEWLFVNKDGGPVRAQGFYNRIWSKAVAKAWPPIDADGKSVKDPFRPRVHDLRHTNASWMLQASPPVPIMVVSDHLGHEDIRTTVSRYGHLDRSSMALAANVIGKCLLSDSTD